MHGTKHANQVRPFLTARTLSDSHLLQFASESFSLPTLVDPTGLVNLLAGISTEFVRYVSASIYTGDLPC